MKTKIIFTEKPERVILCKEFENQIKKSIVLALKNKGIMNQKQCEECIKRIDGAA